MRNNFDHKLSGVQIKEIAQNLVDILKCDAMISEQTASFISNWILTDSKEKEKVFFDVWDIVLKNYMPSKTPILFKGFNGRVKDLTIGSFTGRFDCARAFSDKSKTLIICDTKESLFSKFSTTPGSYQYTFYPLVEVLIKAKKEGGWTFSELLLDYIQEDEYIMRIDLSYMYKVKLV